jgi:hypothetical protein
MVASEPMHFLRKGRGSVAKNADSVDLDMVNASQEAAKLYN